MRRTIILLVTAFVVASGALMAQSSIPGGVLDLRSMLPIPGGSVKRLLLSKLGETLSVRDFGAACDGVTDDSPAVALAATELRGTGRNVFVPSDCRLLMGNGAQPWLSGMGFYSEGIRDNSTTAGGYGQQGGTFLLTSTTQSPFLVSSGWTLKGLKYYWPAQTEAAAVASGGAPVAFPPLIAVHGTDQTSFWSFVDNQVENAYDVMNFVASPGLGHFHFQANLDFALRDHFVLNTAGGEAFLSDNQFSIAAFAYGALFTASTNLRDYAAANAEILHITGNGTATTIPAGGVEGWRLSGNYAYVLHYGIHAVGGTFGLGTLVSNSFDQVQTPIGADSGGLIGATTVTGGTWLCQRIGVPGAEAPCINFNGGAPGSALTLVNVQVPVSVGPGVVFNDTWTPSSGPPIPPSLTILGGSFLNVGQLAGGNPYNAINFIAAYGTLTVNGTQLSNSPASVNSAAQGIVIGGARSSMITGVSFGGFNIPLVYNLTSGNHTATGNTSYGSTSPASTAPIQGAGAGLVAQSANMFDIGSINNVVQVPAGQLGGFAVSGPDTSIDLHLTTKHAGRVVVQSDLGPIAVFQPYGTGAQTAYPILQSASGASSAAITVSSGNLLLLAQNYLLIPTPTLPPCAIGPAGYLCAVSTAPGSAVQVK